MKTRIIVSAVLLCGLFLPSKAMRAGITDSDYEPAIFVAINK